MPEFNLLDLLENRALIATLIAWGLAQVLKMPVQYLRERTWDWSLLLRAGGMPSSHSALVAAIAHSVGLLKGFGSPEFALAVALAMIVVYDATGIRRQAGQHAQIINAIVRDILEGHPDRSQEKLREVLGHSPLEAATGLAMGILIAHLVIIFFP